MAMTEYQRERLEDSSLSLESRFKVVYSLCMDNNTHEHDISKSGQYLKIIADSTSDDQIARKGFYKAGTCLVSPDGNSYFVGFDGVLQVGYALYLQDKYEKFAKDLDQNHKEILASVKVEPTRPKEEPRTEPGAEKEDHGITILKVSEVEKKDIKFLIEPYLVKNNVNVLCGDGGIGKTFCWVDFASAVSKGVLPAIIGVPKEFNEDPKPLDWNDEINDQEQNKNATENHRVLYFTSEDGTDTTLKERFEKAGADQGELFFVSSDDENFHKIMLDSTELEDCIAQVRPALTVFDPLQSFVHGKMGERNNMRRQMDYLTMLAQKYDTTFLIVVHTNKLQTNDARTKLSDSSDIWDKCRSVLFVGRSKDGQRYLSQEKGNYTTDENRLNTQLFTIKDNHILHQGTTDKKYYDFATESTFAHKDTSVRDSAKEFILDTLKGGEMVVKELDESAKSFGISTDTLRKAKKDLKTENKIKCRTESAGKGKGVIWYISLNTVPKPQIE
jgi:hypothetical protein